MAISVGGGTAAAQVGVSPAAVFSGSPALAEPLPALDMAQSSELATRQPIRDSIGRIDFDATALTQVTGGTARSGSGSKRSVTRKFIGGAIGAAAGFFAGGYIGAAIEGDSCHCDDPGLKGALIGAPVGAVAGGILGALFLF
jgi:hypothetical protein